MTGIQRFATDDTRREEISYWNRRSYRNQATTPAGRIFTGMAISAAIVFTAVVGYVANGWTWADATYMVVITIFGVGYGETQPVDTPFLRWLTITLIVCGYVAAIYTVGGFAQLLIDGELRRILGVKRMQKEIDKLSGHVVICGFGRMGRKVAEALATRGRALIVIDQDEDSVEAARGFGCLAIHGNATEEAVLRSAGVERAGILTTVLSDDVANLFITITAHDLNPELEILARAERTSTIKKLRQVGASQVVLPANIGADRLANMILRPSAQSLLAQAKLPEGLNHDLASLGLKLDELEITNGSSLVGGTLNEFKEQCEHRFLIVALRNSDHEVDVHPPGDRELRAGDCVIILAHEEDISILCERYRLQREQLDESPVASAFGDD
ncbi:MAG: potassium channel family protein [Aureliella sp.]